MPSARGTLAGIRGRSARMPHQASSRPTAPPVKVSIALSTSERRSSTQRPAPNAARTAKSLDAPGRPRQQDVGDVGARDHQHEHDGAEEDPERLADVADDLFVRRDQRDAPAGLASGFSRAIPAATAAMSWRACSSVTPGASRPIAWYIRCGRDASAPRFSVNGDHSSTSGSVGRQPEVPRHHADDRVGRVVELQRTADDCRDRRRSDACQVA